MMRRSTIRSLRTTVKKESPDDWLRGKPESKFESHGLVIGLGVLFSLWLTKEIYKASQSESYDDRHN